MIERVEQHNDTFRQIRRQRLMQICVVTSVGLIISLLVARGITFHIFCAALSCLIIALVFAYKRRVLLSAYIMLGSLATMLFSLALTGAGMFDLAILGYPGLLIFAATLGGVGVFITVLSFVIVQCALLTWLALENIITPHIPTLTWAHLLFSLVIITITGFSVFILVRDIKILMVSLQKENAKVQKSQREVQHLAHHDALTGLPNRIYAENLFFEELNKVHSKEHKLALMFIDLDNFKPVNDALGHAAGDELLQRLTHRLASMLPPDHHLTRFGGDEFIVLAPFDGDRYQCNELAQAIIKQCASVFEILHTQVMVSASIGIACAPDDGDNFKQLCRKADIAMYEAKQDGRNTFHYYDKSLDKTNDDKFRLLQRLRPALTSNEFKIYYQPMMSLCDGKVTTIEALLRWPQADGSMISPERFIPLAESSGLINELGHWVIRQACFFCAQQRSLGMPQLRIAVNLSVVQFKSGHLQETVEKALSEAGLPPSALELELTESLLIDNTPLIRQQLEGLSRLGITIAIDDFGTGYSNLSYLRDFKASKLKIDRSFISSICESQDQVSLVKAIIHMAASLGLKTIAEGIEDKATLEKLVTLQCDEGQGFLWAKPLPAEGLAKWLEEHQQSSCRELK